MKIAIGTDDKKNVRKGHFGESPILKVVEISDGKVINSEFRSNTFTAHDIQGKTSKIMEILSDCEIIIGRGFGHKSLQKLEKMGKQAVLTSQEPIEVNIDALQNQNADILKIYNFKTGKFEKWNF